jgi:hypothetical protein
MKTGAVGRAAAVQLNIPDQFRFTFRAHLGGGGARLARQRLLPRHYSRKQRYCRQHKRIVGKTLLQIHIHTSP